MGGSPASFYERAGLRPIPLNQTLSSAFSCTESDPKRAAFGAVHVSNELRFDMFFESTSYKRNDVPYWILSQLN